MSRDQSALADGSRFPFWDDETRYRRAYHVACANRAADDSNPGTPARPFKTIGRAAQAVRPGEKVIVHSGVYRECVRPTRGGEGPKRMIAYEAAAGENVTLKGSEVWRPKLRESRGWALGRRSDSPPIWMADLPRDWFIGYNPFLANNIFLEYTTFVSAWSQDETRRLQKRRGMIFWNGKPLTQVLRPTHLASAGAEGAFWVEEPGSRIHLRLPDGADHRDIELEVTAREQIFAPDDRYLGYVRVSGFRMEHAADGIPVPQRACLSASRGHHWIVEDNIIRWANACGIDIGAQHWSSDGHRPCGGHIVRRNRISDCGICGIAGVTHVDGTLIEGNVVERIGWHDIERLYECAGMKFHVADGMLIRRNVFRHIRHACGLWLDYLNRRCRVTGNVFADISSFAGGCYLEVSHEPNMIDGNVFWDIRGEVWDKGNQRAGISGGHGIRMDSCENVVAAHNLFGKIADGFSLYMSLEQNEREVGGRTGLCRRISAFGNVIVRCPKKILFGRTDENRSDGNLFDNGPDNQSFVISFPQPRSCQNLKGWHQFHGFDGGSSVAGLDVEFDADTLVMTVTPSGKMSPPRMPAWRPARFWPAPGPFEGRDWRRICAGRSVSLKFRAGPDAASDRIATALSEASRC